MTSFIERLVTKRKVALRRGEELATAGEYVLRPGVDIASLVERDLVTQIILISGDSDFVPAAKYARRRGVDFVLDPMWHPVSASLNEHVDGIKSCVKRPPLNEEDPLFNGVSLST